MTNPPLGFVETMTLPNDLPAAFRELSLRAWYLVNSLDRAWDWNPDPADAWQRVHEDANALSDILRLFSGLDVT